MGPPGPLRTRLTGPMAARRPREDGILRSTVEAVALDEQDKRLLNLLQWEFPLEPRPFAVLAGILGATEEDVLRRVSRLKDEKVIRQIGAIFDSRRLGYQSCLVAARAPAEKIEAVAEVINQHPGVSHNYERNHTFNLWFTLTVPESQDLQAEADRLMRESGALSIRLLPTIRLFKIGVRLDLTGEDEFARKDAPAAQQGDTSAPALTEGDMAAVRALQQDLPVVSHPFRYLAADAGMEEGDLLDHARAFIEQGRMRRFAAVLHHRRAGFAANAMGVWSVPDERIAEVGEKMASFKAVSHCYHRPSYPDWPYNLFTMIHGKSAEECEEVAAAISTETGITGYMMLYSTREFKKVRVRYFEW